MQLANIYPVIIGVSRENSGRHYPGSRRKVNVNFFIIANQQIIKRIDNSSLSRTGSLEYLLMGHTMADPKVGSLTHIPSYMH